MLVGRRRRASPSDDRLKGTLDCQSLGEEGVDSGTITGESLFFGRTGSREGARGDWVNRMMGMGTGKDCWLTGFRSKWCTVYLYAGDVGSLGTRGAAGAGRGAMGSGKESRHRREKVVLLYDDSRDTLAQKRDTPT
jgi:hypothetical protein